MLPFEKSLYFSFIILCIILQYTQENNLNRYLEGSLFYFYYNKLHGDNQYIYQYKDHLGNASISFGRDSSGNLELVDVNDFYPFGMNHLKIGNAFFGTGSYKNYKYNGKELQETGMYDYGARFYMQDVGRWGVADPKGAEFVIFPALGTLKSRVFG